MSRQIRIASLQPALRWQQLMPNMFSLREAMEQLPSSLDVVVLPESWTGLPSGQEVDKTATDTTRFLQNLARKRQVIVVGGSIERRNENGDLQNVTLVVNRQGEIVSEYAKRVLFSQEQDERVPGSAPGIFQIDDVRLGVLICADLWKPELTRELIDKVDLVCVPAKTSVPSDNHVEYARQLWHSLALTRAMENGLPIVVSDWAIARHTTRDVDMSLGSAHAPGTTYDRGVLAQRHRPGGPAPDAGGSLEPTATAHTSASPALGPGVHFTAGASTICNPGPRPDISKVQRTLPRGQPGYLYEEIDLAAVNDYQAYRRNVGLMPYS